MIVHGDKAGLKLLFLKGYFSNLVLKAVKAAIS